MSAPKAPLARAAHDLKVARKVEQMMRERMEYWRQRARSAEGVNRGLAAKLKVWEENYR